MEQLQRTNMLIDTTKLANKTVAIFGLGGVGSYVVEGLARCGIDSFVLVDFDTISITNINRHILATHKTVGISKTKIQEQRILDINPNAKIVVYNDKFCNETFSNFDFSSIDYIVDAIDMVTSKILLIETAKKYNIPIICCMGTGNKLDPFAFEINDISKTSVCPLAKTMRYELRKRNIKNVPVLYSKEVIGDVQTIEEHGSRHIPGSISFVPSVAGLLISSFVIKELLK